jgi:hypothetical protein
MGAAARLEAKLIDAGNSNFRDSSEGSFAKVAELWKLNMDWTKRKVFQGGKNRTNELLSIFYNQVFVTNLHTCLYDSQTGMVAGIPPPSIQEYLENMNAGRVVDGRKAI